MCTVTWVIIIVHYPQNMGGLCQVSCYNLEAAGNHFPFVWGSSCITIFHRTMMLPRGNKQQWRPSWPGASSDSIRLLKTQFWWQVNKRLSGKQDGRKGGGAPSSFSLSYIWAGPPVVAAAKWLYILLWMMKHSFQRSWNWVWMFGLVLFNLWFWKEPWVSVLVFF